MHECIPIDANVTVDKILDCTLEVVEYVNCHNIQVILLSNCWSNFLSDSVSNLKHIFQDLLKSYVIKHQKFINM